MIALQSLLDPQIWLVAGLIFLLRVLNMALDTVRVMMVLRNRRVLTWVLGFLQTVIYVVAFVYVIDDLNNIINLVAYAAGFATGNVVGMWAEERMAIGYITLRAISPNLGAALADKLRAEGYAVTEIPARGKDGSVTLLNISLFRRQVGQAMDVIRSIDPNAFTTAEDMRPVSRGFWRL
jgi:uncharacterized protein YebE (UPF0316 family)